MAIQPAVLQGGVALGVASSVLYLAPVATRAVVKRAVFTNSTGAAVTLTVSITRSGGAALTLISAQSVSANSAYTAPEMANLVLAPGDAVGALCSSAASIVAVISGFTL